MIKSIFKYCFALNELPSTVIRTLLSAFFIFLLFTSFFFPYQYEEYGEDFVDMLDGMFSFVLIDTRDKSFIAARDAIGITPLYMGWGLDGM